MIPPAPGGKSADAFRTIGEAAAEIGVPHHVLRFWETRFPALQPLKRGGNRRYYRPADMALLRTIHRMLHEDGLTIRGAQKALADGGFGTSGASAHAHVRPQGEASMSSPADSPPSAASIDAARLRAIHDRLAAALAA